MTIIHNPVLPGFHPDPSLCRAGSDYYLVTSTFEYFPGVPVFHSADLVNWRQIGYCLTRKSQLNLDRLPPSCGIFAPTIRFHNGAFYMITTLVGGGGNFYVTTQDPAGPWSEPVWVDREMFDPSLFFDEDGKVYYTRRGERGIVQAEIDITTGKLLTPLRMIVEKYICTDIEGPHLYKIRGQYYLMAAEGGTRFGHCEVIGRSEGPWGPFEPCPHNPFLTHRDQSHPPIRDTGHAELIEDAAGNWWLFCLGTRHLRYDSATILGRETFLSPLTWKDGWPWIENNHLISESFETRLLPPQVPSPTLWRDDFDQSTLDLGWNFLRNPYEADWSLTEQPGCLRLKGSAVSLQDWDSPAFIGRRQEHFKVEASCQVAFEPRAENEEAGLTVLMSNLFHYDLAVALRQGSRRVVLKKRVGDIVQEIVSPPVAPGPLVLWVEADGLEYRFSYQEIGEQDSLTPTPLPRGEGILNSPPPSGEGLGVREPLPPAPYPLGSGLARLLSSELAGPSDSASIFTGMYFGLYATGNGQPCQAPADFDWFKYKKAGSAL